MLEGLKLCFREDFTKWLLKSNNPKVVKDLDYDSYKWLFIRDGTAKILTDDNILVRAFQLIEKESLEEILNIILREPLSDYFWYGYKEEGGKLFYSLPHHVVPEGSLRVDHDRLKLFFRDIKLQELGI
jgi:hypothetical protein